MAGPRSRIGLALPLAAILPTKRADEYPASFSTRQIAFCVQALNEVLPHSAFHGQTRDEVYFGTGSANADELAIGRSRAREARMDQNR